MFDRENWQEIFDTLRKNKLRTFLTAFGVGWGMLMLVVMLGAGAGLENGVRQQMTGIAANSIFVWSRATTLPYKGYKEGRFIRLNNNDTKAMQEQIPEIELLSPGLQLGGWRGANNIKRGDKIGAFEINGYLPVAREIKLMKMRSGRFINEDDVTEKRKVCVIGKRVREVMFDEGEDPIGKYLQVQGVHFMVVGIFKSSRYGDDAENEEQSIYIPFSAFQLAFNQGNTVHWYVITSKASVPASVVHEKVTKLLKDRHSIHPDDPAGIGGFNAEEEFQQMNNIFTGIRFLSWFVGFFTLIAGVIGVSNIMLVIIRERTREIGVRRSIGATPRHVITQVLMESVTLTTLAGISGIVGGVWLLEFLGTVVEHEVFTSPQVSIRVILTALLILVVSGALAGMMPAKRAVQINPVDALRSE